MDIIIFAVIAIFIFFKLRQQLGRIDEDQKRDAIKKFIREQTDSTADKPIAVIETTSRNNNDDLVKNSPQDDIKSRKILDNINPAIRSDFETVLTKASLSPSEFMDGAIRAFEMVLEAFAKGNINDLKPLLADTLYKQFSVAITQRKNAGQVLETRIVAIDKMEVTQVRIDNNFLVIAIKFNSRQINYITDSNATIIEGSKDQINEMIDVWSFKKDVNSRNPNWFIASTQGYTKT